MPLRNIVLQVFCSICQNIKKCKIKSKFCLKIRNLNFQLKTSFDQFIINFVIHLKVAYGINFNKVQDGQFGHVRSEIRGNSV